MPMAALHQLGGEAALQPSLCTPALKAHHYLEPSMQALS